jgi:hypothetical protein
MAQTVILRGQSQRLFAKNLIDRAPVDAVVTVREAARTLDQNALMWSLISDVSRAKPEGRMHTPEVWKCLFLSACGHAVQFEVGLDGKPFPVGFHSSRLNKAQMSDLLDFIQEYGARHNVNWTTPDYRKAAA